MLTFKPELRASAEEAACHDWFKVYSKESQPIQMEVLQRLNNFQVSHSDQVKCKLQYAIMTFIVTQIEKGNEIKELLKYFTEIDKDRNGVIAKDELAQEFLRQKFIENNDLAEAEMAKVIGFLDGNKSGQIDYTEFVLAAIEKEKLLSEANLRNCFKMFDKVSSINKDEDGFLSMDELKDVMEGLDADEERWRILLQKIDINNDGKVVLI